jgi:transposase
MYSQIGRPSIPPEKLLRALLLQVLYTVRSERMLRLFLSGQSRCFWLADA